MGDMSFMKKLLDGVEVEWTHLPSLPPSLPHEKSNMNTTATCC